MKKVNSSEDTRNIIQALFEARKEMGPAIRDATNGNFKSRYATLNAVLAACMGPLEKQGVLVIQYPVSGDVPDMVRVITELRHVPSGEYICCATDVPMYHRKSRELGEFRPDAQAMGSAVTYGRRYALTAILGIPQEDDDGNGASVVSHRKGDSSLRKKEASKQLEPGNDGELRKMYGMLRKKHGEDRDAMFRDVIRIIGRSIASSADMTGEEVEKVVAALA